MIVVKVGGSDGINYNLVLQDLVKFDSVILVHGGSGELNKLSNRLGKPPKMVKSVSGIESRRTDRETLELFNMVYCGKMNKMIVEKLQSLGKNAVGLSGLDGGLLTGKRKNLIIRENGKKKVVRDDYTGKIRNVNSDLLKLLMSNGYLPVVTPPALSENNEAINVDGDRAAAEIAISLGADHLIILSNTPGLLRDTEDESSLIPCINKSSRKMAMNYAKGRMKKKIIGSFEAVEQGITHIVLGDGRIKNPITQAVRGKGTVIE